MAMPAPNPKKPAAPRVAPEQLSQLFEEYGAKVYGLARRCGLPPKEAEDGVQEVFLKVQRRISTFRGEAALSTWLYQVALNTLRDYRRKVTRMERATPMSLLSDRPADPTFEGAGDSPSTEASREERRQMVRDAIDRLSPKFREVLILRELEGLSYRDVARVLKVKQGTVESRIYRARERLARELEKLGVKDGSA